MALPQVLLIGAGGVGTVVAHSIHYKKRAEVSIVVRRDFEKVQHDGYEIESFDHGHIPRWKPNHIFPSVEAAADFSEGKEGFQFDYVIVTTKNLPDITRVEDLIEPIVTSAKTTIVLIQNGFDIGRPVIAKYPQNICLSGISFIGSHNFNGVVHQISHEITQISYFPNENLPTGMQQQKAQEFVEIYSTDKNSVTYKPDDKYARYRKILYNATLNPICTLTGTDSGRIQFAGGYETLVVPAMKEIIAVAKGDGVDIPITSINELCHADDGSWYTPSMAVDARKGNPLETEVIMGNLLRKAQKVNVKTPILNVIYHLLQIVQFKLKEKKGLVSVPEERPVDKSKTWV